MHSFLQRSEDHDTWATIPSRFDSAEIRWDRCHFGYGLVDCTQRGDFMFTQTGDSSTPSGKKIEVEPLKSQDVPQVCNLSNLKEKTPFDVPVVCEYPDVFPEELPGMPPD